MKTKIVMGLCAGLLALANPTFAQGGGNANGNPPSAENNPESAENVEKQAKSLAKDFGLKDDAKTSFIDLYKAYRTEMSQASAMQRDAMQKLRDKRQESRDANKESSKKRSSKNDNEELQLTDDEANMIIMADIQSKKEQADVQLRYYAQFRKTLTPSQCYKIMRENRDGNRRQQGNNNNQNMPNFGGSNGMPGGGFGPPPGGGF